MGEEQNEGDHAQNEGDHAQYTCLKIAGIVREDDQESAAASGLHACHVAGK